MKFGSAISFVVRLLALWFVIHAVPPVHAQEMPPPPSAAERRLQLEASSYASTHQPRPRPGPREHTALLITGLDLFISSYLTGFLLAGMGIAASEKHSCSGCGYIFLPLAGPWVALAKGGGGGLVALGAGQDLGFLAAIIGEIVFTATREPQQAARQRDRFTFAAAPTRDGAQLALRLSL